MSLLFSPNQGHIKPSRSKEIKVELVMKISTSIDEPVIIEAIGGISLHHIGVGYSFNL